MMSREQCGAMISKKF